MDGPLDYAYYDIHALYTKVITIANKATLISHALEVKKIFEMPFNGSDIFQYHSELQQQIEMVQAQGESLGLDSVIPPWMEQSLLLIAAWKSPNYRKIALEFTMDNVQVEIDALVGELQKQQLLTTHLNRSNESGSRSDRPRGDRSDTRVHQATTAGVKYCFGFQRGACARGSDCPFVHEKDPSKQDSRPGTSSGGKPQAKMARDQMPKKQTNKKGGAPRGRGGGRGGSRGGRGEQKDQKGQSKKKLTKSHVSRMQI